MVRTDEKGDRIEYISEDQLERELVDAESFPNPGQEAVNSCNKRDDGQHVGPLNTKGAQR